MGFEALKIKPMLLPEILGFSPHLLLDDIVDVNTNTNWEAVSAMESMLQKWASEPSSHKKPHSDIQITEEIREGLAAFESLIVYQSDLAIDSFESWCLRNVFDIPTDLPYVLPQQADADFSATPEKENELIDEMDSIRKKIQEQRQLSKQLRKAARVSSSQRRQAEKRREQLSFLLSSDTLSSFQDLPILLPKLYTSFQKLPPLDETTLKFLAACAGSHPGQRPWETSKTGYINWAVTQLLNRAKEKDVIQGSVDGMVAQAAQIGSPDQLREALDIVEVARSSLAGKGDESETQPDRMVE